MYGTPLIPSVNEVTCPVNSGASLTGSTVNDALAEIVEDLV